MRKENNNGLEIIKHKLESKKGIFFIGDPCYILDSYTYDELWGKKNDYQDGFYYSEKYENHFQVTGTICGDGIYKDNLCNLYSVDSGTLSVIPFELFKENIKKFLLENNLNTSGISDLLKIGNLGYFVKSSSLETEVDGKTLKVLESKNPNHKIIISL